MRKNIFSLTISCQWIKIVQTLLETLLAHIENMKLADGTTKVLKHIASHAAKNLASFLKVCVVICLSL